MGRMLTLHAFDMSSIPGTLHGSLDLSEVIPEYRTRGKALCTTEYATPQKNEVIS